VKREPLTLDEWRLFAKRRLPRFAFDYLEGGADEESALVRNRSAFRRFMLVPDRFVDLSNCTTEQVVLGARQRSPIVVAPLGLAGLFWKQGDLALARAAGRAGVPFILSSASTSRIESVAACEGSDKWFQLYVVSDRRITRRLLSAAQGAGFRVLVLTLDVPLNGNRLRDLRNRFSFPLRAHPQLILDCVLHPRWFAQLLANGIPALVNFESADGVSGRDAQAALLQRSLDRSLTWEFLSWIRSHWQGPLVLKGILSERDAELACAYGVDGIVVSNHGGRQLDSAPSSMDVLARIVDSTSGRADVLIDGGFRNGSDVIKAIALGATAVLIGRPVLYGLSATGERGAFSVLNWLQEDLTRTMVLAGYPRIDRLSRSNLFASDCACSCLRSER
jgi:(S)-mandelate dehydrogenase